MPGSWPTIMTWATLPAILRRRASSTEGDGEVEAVLVDDGAGRRRGAQHEVERLAGADGRRAQDQLGHQALRRHEGAHAGAAPSPRLARGRSKSSSEASSQLDLAWRAGKG